jgi:hypothetical protein
LVIATTTAEEEDEDRADDSLDQRSIGRGVVVDARRVGRLGELVEGHLGLILDELCLCEVASLQSCELRLQGIVIGGEE